MSKLTNIPQSEINNAVLTDTISKSLTKSVSELEQEEQLEFYAWLTGRIREEPEFVKSLINNLAYKINVSMGFLSATSVTRLFKLNAFMAKAEDQIFSPENINNFNFKELTDAYKLASATILQTMEFVRRYLSQNEGAMDFDASDESMKISKLLSTFTPEKLTQIKSMFESVGTDDDE